MTWYDIFHLLQKKNGAGAVDGTKLGFVCWLGLSGESLGFIILLYLYVHLKADMIKANSSKTPPPPKPEMKLNIPMKWIAFFLINKEVAA